MRSQAATPVRKGASAPTAEINLAARRQRMVFDDLSWKDYRAIADAIGERSMRLTFDDGRLELMTISSLHERWKSLLGRLFETLLLELRVRSAALGSTTWDRKDLQIAFEPDECYYIQNEPAVRGKLELSLETDPPPDLVLEVEVSRAGSARRMNVFAKAGVPEVWRFRGGRLSVFHLTDACEYRSGKRSSTFPFLPLAKFAEFVRKASQLDELTLVRSFVRWIRSHPEWKDLLPPEVPVG